MAALSRRSLPSTKPVGLALTTRSCRLYARGMTVREIQSHLEEMYGAEVSPSLISSVTDAVMDDAKAWQAPPLDALYPIVYLDCIHVKTRDAGAVRAKAVYLALGISMSGEKELLGLWIAQTEGCQVLAAGGHRTQEPGRAGHLHCLRRWLEGLPRGH
jgi:transposase-like protein